MKAVDAYEIFGKRWSDIQTHLPMLRAFGRGNVLEIGVRDGISTAALLAGIGSQGGHLWSVDIVDASKIFDDDPNWTFIQGHSVKDADRILGIIGRPLHVLFIDSDHSFDITLEELETYGPLVRREDGVILLHDTELPGAGVEAALEQYGKEIGKEPSYCHGSFGLGVLVP